MLWNRKKESRCKADDDMARAFALLGCGSLVAVCLVIFLVATVVKVWVS